jgi:hypothetical protein
MSYLKIEIFLIVAPLDIEKKNKSFYRKRPKKKIPLNHHLKALAWSKRPCSFQTKPTSVGLRRWKKGDQFQTFGHGTKKKRSVSF